MASLGDGTYWICSVGNTACRLDVAGGSAKDGADVRIWNANTGNAQVFNVISDASGGRLIVSRYSGKAVDVAGGSVAAGTNVQQWKRNGTRAQMWSIVDASSTVTIEGTTYDAFYIRPYSNQGLAAQAQSASSGATVKLAANGASDAQKWAFVPVPRLISGGVYEIHSMLDKAVCLDVKGASTVKGANVQLYSSNGSDAQKFAIYDEGDGHSIRSVASDMFIDVAGGSVTTNDANVQQWTDNDSRAQRWSITQYGTATYKGVTCAVVEFGAGNGTSYLMDVQNAKATNSANVQIHTANHTDAQKFLLYPTDYMDEKIPAPTDVRFELTQSVTASSKSGTQPVLSVAWTSPQSWAAAGMAHFEHSYRMRTMDQNAIWSDWGDWSAWTTSLVSQDGTKSVLEDELTQALDVDSCLAAQWDFRVRSVTDKNTSTYPANVHGGSSSQVLTLYCQPTVTFSAATWSPLGLSIPYESDWDASTLRIVSSSQWHESHTHEGAKNGTIVVPSELLTKVPADGATMELTYRTGTAQQGAFPEEAATVAMSKASGAVQATQSQSGYARSVTITGSGTKRAWLCYGDSIFELEGNGTFDVPYPMGVAYGLYVALGTTVAYLSATASQDRIAAWYHKGKSFYAPLVVRGSLAWNVAQDSERRRLDSRPETAVDFGPTRETTVSVTVRIYGLSGEMTLAEMRELVGTHCIFRTPDGRFEEVAVDSISETDRGHGVVDVLVSMVREAR